MNRSKAKGTSWESAIVDFLKTEGVLHAERRTLAGAKDRGDIAGIPGVVIEGKSVAKLEPAKHIDEANIEAHNDGADLGVAWVKRRGKTCAGSGFVLMDGHTFVRLLRAAQYIPELPASAGGPSAQVAGTGGRPEQAGAVESPTPAATPVAPAPTRRENAS